MTYVAIVLLDLQKIGLKWESNQQQLDTSVSDNGPYPATIRYLQHASKSISGVVLSCAGYPHQWSCLLSGGNPIIGIWKKPDREKLPGVHPPVGSDEGSSYASVCVPSGGNPITGTLDRGSEGEIPPQSGRLRMRAIP